jgi:hypothetical protein
MILPQIDHKHSAGHMLFFLKKKDKHRVLSHMHRELILNASDQNPCRGLGVTSSTIITTPALAASSSPFMWSLCFIGISRRAMPFANTMKRHHGY